MIRIAFLRTHSLVVLSLWLTIYLRHCEVLLIVFARPHFSPYTFHENPICLAKTSSDSPVFDHGDVDHIRRNTTIQHEQALASICLRSMTPQSKSMLRILRRYPSNWEVKRKNSFKEFQNESWCWYRIPDNVSETSNNSQESFISEKNSNNNDFRVRLRKIESQKARRTPNGEKFFLSQKVEFLLGTIMVRNHEIVLPAAIAALDNVEMPIEPNNVKTTVDDSDLLQISPEARINLSGRWKPSCDVDLYEYDEFLKACCSDSLSYWKRQVLSSSTVVSRQVLDLIQSEDGRLLELGETHPLLSDPWNRTIVTTMQGGRNFVKNQILDPMGKLILVEAYWQQNGTVHTTLIRKEEVTNGNHNGIDHTTKSPGLGWLHVHRYLWFGDKMEDNQTYSNHDAQTSMIVETIYHTGGFPEDPKEAISQTHFPERSGIEETKSAMAMTKMVWNWERVPK